MAFTLSLADLYMFQLKLRIRVVIAHELKSPFGFWHQRASAALPNLKRKQDAFVLEFLEARGDETIELRGTLAAAAILRQRFQDFQDGHLATKVSLVQFLPEDGFIHGLQLTQSKLLGQQLESHR